MTRRRKRFFDDPKKIEKDLGYMPSRKNMRHLGYKFLIYGIEKYHREYQEVINNFFPNKNYLKNQNLESPLAGHVGGGV